MRLSIYYLPIFLFPFFLNAQNQQWANYVSDFYINDIAVEGNDVWVGTWGGLLLLNKLSGEKQIFLPENSGIKGIGVRTIHVDKNGIKWIGTEQAGLMRYDGENWNQYYFSDSGETMVTVSSIKSSENGDLWFLTTGNESCAGCPELFRFTNDKIINMDSLFGDLTINGGSVQSFDIADDGAVWVTSYDQITKYENDTVSLLFDSASFPLEPTETFGQIISLTPDEVIVATSKYNQAQKFRLFKYNGIEWSHMSFGAGTFTGGEVTRFYLDQNNNIWLQYNKSTSKHYAKFDGTSWQNLTEEANNVLPPIYNGANLQHVGKKGQLWFSGLTHNGIHAPKLFRVEGENLYSYDTEIYPMINYYFNDLSIDCNNDIWAGDKGFNIFNGIEWSEILPAELGVGVNVSSMVYDRKNCRLWATSSSVSDQYGLISIDSGGVSAHGGGQYLYDLDIDQNGNIWVTSPPNGIGKYDGNTWKWYNDSNSPLTDYVAAITVDATNGIWASTLWNGLVYYDGTNWLVFNETNSPVSNHARLLYIDKAGVVWATAPGGFLRFDGNNWVQFKISDSPYSPNTMKQDIYGNYWIGTTLEGVYHWKGGNDLTQYTVNNSPLGSNSVRRIEIDTFGNKWFLTSRGVCVFNENGITKGSFQSSNKDRERSPWEVGSGEMGEKMINEKGQQIKLPALMTQKKLNGTDILLYPNPTKSGCWVEWINPAPDNNPWSINIFDSTGRLHFSTQTKGEKFWVEGLNSGFYIVSIKKADKVFSSKLVVTPE